MKNIVWVSRHVPTTEQTEELREWVGDRFNLVFVNKTIDNVSEIIDKTDDDTVGIMVVLSPELLSEIVKVSKVPVIRAVTKRMMTSRGTFEFIHDHFEIVEVFVYKTVVMNDDRV